VAKLEGDRWLSWREKGGLVKGRWMAKLEREKGGLVGWSKLEREKGG
jgi:hypothetical protein